MTKWCLQNATFFSCNDLVFRLQYDKILYENNKRKTLTKRLSDFGFDSQPESIQECIG
jgi:hypothetical protein